MQSYPRAYCSGSLIRILSFASSHGAIRLLGLQETASQVPVGNVVGVNVEGNREYEKTYDPRFAR